MNPDLQFFGLGGAKSGQAGVDILFDISKLALVGVIEVLKNISAIREARNAIMARIDREKPDLAILIDYPGFNLRLAKALHKKSIPVIYYVSPQVWAWGRDRINLIKKYVKKMVVFFKFEEELYKTYDVDAEFVGHPLLDIVKVSRSRLETLKKYEISGDKLTVAILPGSRTMEIKGLLSIMAKSASLIKERLKDVQFIIARHPDLPLQLYEDAVKGSGVDFVFASGDTYNILGASDFAIVTSGTATLETAMIGTPLAILYKVNLITYILYLIVRRIRFIGLVNIIADHEVAPELLQYNATPSKIADKVTGILSNKDKLSSIRKELKTIRSSLGTGGACKRAAEVIFREIN
jgi:lipid-A-disaccharide synthase